MIRLAPLVLLLVAGCSGTAGAGQAPGHGRPGHVMLAAVAVPGLGTVVTAADGKTLYRSDKDTARPPVSTCDGPCAGTWPPVLAGEAPPMLQGVEESHVGTLVRTDGSRQLTLDGWALYEYSGDQAPGQANGHGVDGTWFAVTPGGGKLTRSGN